MAYCPQDYTCTFTLVHPRVIEHTTNPWWEREAGVAVAIIGIIAIACLAAYLMGLAVNLYKESRDTKTARLEKEAEHKRRLQLEEQKTFQLDLVKGDVAGYEQLRRMG